MIDSSLPNLCGSSLHNIENSSRICIFDKKYSDPSRVTDYINDNFVSNVKENETCENVANWIRGQVIKNCFNIMIKRIVKTFDSYFKALKRTSNNDFGNHYMCINAIDCLFDQNNENMKRYLAKYFVDGITEPYLNPSVVRKSFNEAFYKFMFDMLKRVLENKCSNTGKHDIAEEINRLNQNSPHFIIRTFMAVMPKLRNQLGDAGKVFETL